MEGSEEEDPTKPAGTPKGGQLAPAGLADRIRFESSDDSPIIKTIILLTAAIVASIALTLLGMSLGVFGRAMSVANASIEGTWVLLQKLLLPVLGIEVLSIPIWIPLLG